MPTQKKRMEWLDAMRGFTMILVVMCHVSGIAFGVTPKYSSAGELLALFRMPMFFFVSGFLAYKASMLWTGKTLSQSLLKKIRVQIIPTVVFLVACVIYFHKNWWPHLLIDLENSRKGGYWFTWVLLQMFVVYYLFAFVEQKLLNRQKQAMTPPNLPSGEAYNSPLRGDSGGWSLSKFQIPTWLPITLLWIFSILLYESAYLPKMFTYPKEYWAEASSFVCFAMYFCFFVSGNICRRYWGRVERLFDSRWFFPVMVFTAFLCCIEVFKWHNLQFEWRNLPMTIAIFALLAIILMFFRSNEQTFSKQTRLGRVMQYIGTRTLDIYLIHYFFIPKLPMIGPWVKQYRPNTVIELTMSLTIALLVIAFSCLTSSVLRTSPLLKKYLFGKE